MSEYFEYFFAHTQEKTQVRIEKQKGTTMT